MNYLLSIAWKIKEVLGIVAEAHAKVDPAPQVSTKATSCFCDGVSDDGVAPSACSSSVDGLDMPRFRKSLKMITQFLSLD